MPVMYLALCQEFDFSVFTESSHYPYGFAIIPQFKDKGTETQR